MGWYFAHHVYETNYTIETEKEMAEDGLRVALISDSHVGTPLMVKALQRI